MIKKILIWFLLVLILVFGIVHKSASFEKPLEPIYAEATEITCLEVNPYEIKTYARFRVSLVFGLDQWIYFDDLIQRESRWDSEAQNPNSSAYGLGQFLNSTWETVECEKTDNPHRQIDCTIDYVKKNYGSPQQAILYHNLHNHY